MDNPGELFELVDEAGRIIGQASRGECHSNPALLHRAVHVLVFNSVGQLFLQKRQDDKDIQPGKWDSSVGGHLALGETYEAAAVREMGEELGIVPPTLTFLHRYVWRTEVESELVQTYRGQSEGPFQLQREELAGGRFFSRDELAAAAARGALTPNLVHELTLLELL